MESCIQGVPRAGWGRAQLPLITSQDHEQGQRRVLCVAAGGLDGVLEDFSEEVVPELGSSGERVVDWGPLCMCKGPERRTHLWVAGTDRTQRGCRGVSGARGPQVRQGGQQGLRAAKDSEALWGSLSQDSRVISRGF